MSSFNGSTNFISSGQGYFSSLNVNSLVFGPGNGWLDLTALRAILVSSIQIDAGIGNFSSISGNGSQIVALNAISSLSLQSTVVGLGNIYLSSGGATQVSINSTIVGLGTFGYISSTQLTSTVTGLGNIYLSSGGATQVSINSTILGLGTFGYISSTQLQSTVRKLETYYSIITLSTTANLSVSSLTFVEINTNSTTSLYYRSSMIYVGNNILYGALQYTPQFITF
jgi:hypothetical protein